MTRLEKLYRNLRDKLIESKEIDFYEDSREITQTFTSKEDCMGCFEIINDTPKLIVAVGGDKPTAYGVFIHEYCHYLQWKENDPYYLNEWLTKEEAKRFKKFFKKLKLIECNYVLDYWKVGKYELSPEEVSDFTRRTIEVEWDCERRVIELLKENKVSKKYIDDYTQKANLYLVKYLYQQKHRIWKDTSTVYKKMPKILMNLEDLRELSPEFEKLIMSDLKKIEG